jgi:hypothetical protein
VLRFCCLGSGSEGNALVVESRDGLFATRVLVDNGFKPSSTTVRAGSDCSPTSARRPQRSRARSTASTR